MPDMITTIQLPINGGKMARTYTCCTDPNKSDIFIFKVRIVDTVLLSWRKGHERCCTGLRGGGTELLY